MFKFKFLEETYRPKYMTKNSAGADLIARESLVIAPMSHGKIATGVWIESVEWEKVPSGYVPELQIRARSGLSFKYGIGLSNGVGTIDADYRDEICVLLWNASNKEFEVKKGDRIAQMVCSFVLQIPSLTIGEERQGGFGSTGKSVIDMLQN